MAYYMCKIEEKITQALYLSILQYGVMETIEWYLLNPSCVVSQHHNDPKDTTKLVKQCLSMQNYDVLTRPPQSYDLNPMEHVWELVKWKSYDYSTLARGMLQLQECAQASSHSITIEKCQ